MPETTKNEPQNSSVPLPEEEIDELYRQVESVFRVYEIAYENEALLFYGIPKTDLKTLAQKLWVPFAEKGYQLHIRYELGEHVLIAVPVVEVRERVWVNAVLVVATIFTTMLAGATMYGVDLASNPSQFVQGLPFTIAIMTVLGSHEMGHYIAARLHGMRTSLPYFIPFPTLIGTMGAIIKHRGPIPNRKALFDVGVAGPLVGLVVSVIVALVGLTLPPVTLTTEMSMLELQLPPLFLLLVKIVGPMGETMHPVAFAGWVGMLVTLLNLFPAGQLDGGHILRAMIGERAVRVARIMPFILLVIGAYVSFLMKENGFIWLFWAVFLSLFAVAGHPTPLNDDIKLDDRRFALGVFTFILGLLCFTLIPFTIVYQ
jgi:membrane-associated protease RseP (regulator of RpoE activity)